MAGLQGDTSPHTGKSGGEDGGGGGGGGTLSGRASHSSSSTSHSSSSPLPVDLGPSSSRWSSFVNKSAVLTCVALVLAGLAICLFLYYYLRAGELRRWSDQMHMQCNDRLNALRYFVVFSVSSMRSVAGFGLNAQTVQARNGSAQTQLDFARFVSTSPTQQWFDQIIFQPRVRNESRRVWEEQVGYFIFTPALDPNNPTSFIALPAEGEDLFPWQFFHPFNDRTRIATGVAPSPAYQGQLLDYIRRATMDGSIDFSIRNLLAFSQEDGEANVWGVVVTLPLFVDGTQNVDVFDLPSNRSAPALSTGVAPPPIEQRWDQLVGVVQSVIRIGTLLRAALNTLQYEEVQVRIFDTSVTEEESFIAEYSAGHAGGLLLPLFPTLEQIIGAQPAPKELPAQETAARLITLLVEFLCLFSSRERPLVTFFDDCQWSDRFSLEVIERFVRHESCAYTLVLLSSRMQSESRELAFASMIERIEKNNVRMTHLIATPLSLDNINHFAAESLHCSLLKSLPLASVLFTKTAGSPLFVKQMLQALHREGLLTFSFRQQANQTQQSHQSKLLAAASTEATNAAPLKGEWRYEMTAVHAYFDRLHLHADGLTRKAQVAAANATAAGTAAAAASADSSLGSGHKTDAGSMGGADSHILLFLQRHLEQLSPISQEVLAVASCVGLEFSLEMLLKATRYPASLIRVALQEPIKEELVTVVASTRSGHARSNNDELATTTGTGVPGLTAGTVQPLHGLDYQQPSPMPQENSTSSHIGFPSSHRSSLVASHSSQSGEGGAVDQSDIYNVTATQAATAAGTLGGHSTFGGHYSSRMREPAHEIYAFAHDKVLEAIYTSVPVDKRAAVHMQLASLLYTQHATQIAQMKAKMHAAHIAAGLLAPSAAPVPAPGPAIAAAPVMPAAPASNGSVKAALLTPAQLQMRKAAAAKNAAATTTTTPTVAPSTGVVAAATPTGTTDVVALEVAAAPPGSFDFLFQIANHYLKSLHVLVESQTLRRDAAELLLLAAVSARSNGSYLTSLYFTKASMFLMRIEKVAPTTENSNSASASAADSHSEERQARVEAINTIDTSAQLDALEHAIQVASASSRLTIAPPAQAQIMPPTPNNRALTVVPPSPAPASALLTPSSGASGARSLPGIGGHFNSGVSSSASALTRADITAKGMTVAESDASWSVASDYALLYDLSFLRGELEYLCGHHRRSFTHFQLCLQHTTMLRQQISCFKQLIRLKTIAGQYRLAIVLGVRALSLLHYEFRGLRLDGKEWECDQRAVESHFEEIMEAVRARGCEGEVGRLFNFLPPCSDPRLTLVGEILVELIYPSHLVSQTLLQLVVFTSVGHALRHGVCKQEGFAFCMFGASLLAKSVLSDSFWAKDAQQWGALGLNLCLKFNSQSDYCRSLLANGLYISSFTGHMERSLRELKQAVYIGSIVGDLQFVTQSSLAIVLLQQYTQPLTRWRQMVQQTDGENHRSLQDRTVARYAEGMLLIIDSLQGTRTAAATDTNEMGDSSNSSSRMARVGGGGGGGGSGATLAPLVDPDDYSPAERRFVAACQQESMNEPSVHLSLFAITKAKVQYLFRAPGAAVETLKLVSFDLIVSYPEVTTFLLVQSLAYLALIRQHMDDVSAQAHAKYQQAQINRRNARLQNSAAAAAPAAAAAATVEEEPDLPEIYELYWLQVARNQLALSRYSTSNARDFSCMYLLVKAEMAYTALSAFDCGFVLPSVAELSADLLPPTEAREQDQSYERDALRAGRADQAAADKAAGITTSAAKQNQLGEINRAKVREDCREAAEEERRKDQAQHAAKSAFAALPAGASLGLGSDVTALRRSDKHLLASTSGSKRRVRTILSDDPFLRDQLVARIFTVYSSAAALTISSRSSSNFQRGPPLEALILQDA